MKWIWSCSLFPLLSPYIFHFQSVKHLYVVNNATTTLGFKPGFLIPRKKRVVDKELLLRLNCLRLCYSNPFCIWWKSVFLITPVYFQDSFAWFLIIKFFWFHILFYLQTKGAGITINHKILGMIASLSFCLAFIFLLPSLLIYLIHPLVESTDCHQPINLTI